MTANPSSDRLDWNRAMVRIRLFEEKVQELFMTGQIHGTTHLCQGQEAVSVGAIAAMRPRGVQANTDRGHGEALALGLAPAPALDDLARRPDPYGMPGIVVDGQDIDAVHGATVEAAERARRGDGPSLLEMKTYRYRGHSRSDPAKYRPAGELDAWKARDPIEL